MHLLSKKVKFRRGFTIPEILMVIAILVVIFSILIVATTRLREKSRDAQRVQVMQSISVGIELYKKDNGFYPPAGGLGHYGWVYRDGSGGSCGSQYSQGNAFHIDNANSFGFLESFSGNYLTFDDWIDPLGTPHNYSDVYNCRYIVICDPPVSKAKWLDCKGIKYALHCNLEVSDDLEKNDGGFNDDLYEIMGPNRWLCTECPGGTC